MRKTSVLIAGLAITVGVAVWAATYHLYLGHTGFGFMLVFYLVVAGIVVFYMMSALLSGDYSKLPRPDGENIAVIATYNEPTEALHSTVWALINSSCPPSEIHVMDDGSEPPAETFDHPLVRWHRQANMGKRYAQVNTLRIIMEEREALEYPLPEFITTVDGDSTLDHHALDQLSRPFSNPVVQGATGLILVRNWDSNVLTRAQDLDIGTSCLLVRTSRSVFGAVSPTSGAMAMYRSGVLFDNLDDYASSGTNGDDRRLSLYSLVRRVRVQGSNGKTKTVKGKVVAVNSAMVHSAMPTEPKDLFKQRLRWGKSGWQSLPFEIINLSFVPLVFRLYALILAILLPFMYGYVGVSVAMHGHVQVIGIALAASMVIRYGETSLYAMMRPGLTTWQRLSMWLFMTPVAFVMNWVIIRPAKYWALTKLKARGWETRGNAHAVVKAKPRLYLTKGRWRQRWVLRAAAAAILGGGAAMGFGYWSVLGDGKNIDPIAPIVAQAPAIGSLIEPKLPPHQVTQTPTPTPTTSKTNSPEVHQTKQTSTTHRAVTKSPTVKPTTVATPTPKPTTKKPTPTPSPTTPTPTPSEGSESPVETESPSPTADPTETEGTVGGELVPDLPTESPTE